MAKGSKMNILLVEIIIAVLFFALASTVILETFVTVRSQSRLAGAYNEAMAAAQNLADQLYAGAEPAQVLAAAGYARESEQDAWQWANEDYSLSVTIAQEEMSVGSLRRAEIKAWQGEKELFTLPLSRYLPREVIQ